MGVAANLHTGESPACPSPRADCDALHSSFWPFKVTLFQPSLGGRHPGWGETSVPTTPCGKQQGLAAARGEQQQGRLTCFLPSGRSQKDQEGSLANTRGAFTVSR